ncbi:MAG TPA: hypothetical protein VFY31_07215 [Macromonas sp.]|nr:hypothetical protein [Macromonas sp.]
MTNVIALVRPVAPALSTTDTTHPETIRLHGLAENALSTALHCLRSVDCSPAKLQTATARAVRAATLLKRACEAANLAGEV